MQISILQHINPPSGLPQFPFTFSVLQLIVIAFNLVIIVIPIQLLLNWFLCITEFRKGKLFALGLEHLHISFTFLMPFISRSQIRSWRKKNKLYSSQSIHSPHPQQSGSESNLLHTAIRKQQKATYWARQNTSLNNAWWSWSCFNVWFPQK